MTKKLIKHIAQGDALGYMHSNFSDCENIIS
jgi:hypothetical protein